MLLHYFKIARKALLKNKYYTIINVLGLVFGMLSALTIAKYIGGSLQFDAFHQNKSNIYAVTQEESIQGNAQSSSRTTYWGVGELVRQYPGVVNSTRYSYHVESLVMTIDGKGNRESFIENKIFAVDSSFLNIFTFPLLYGNTKTALSRVNSIVLTRSTSQKYFGDGNPIGSVMLIRAPWGAETTYEVTGVAEDTPQRSRFQFNFLITPPPLPPEEYWIVPDCSTYLLVKENAHTGDLPKALTSTLNDLPQFKSANRKVKMSLELLTGVPLSSTEYLLAAVGIFIVLISWVNYINQVIAQSYWRIKEIGVLRVMGATKVNLKMQFVVESSLVCLIALTLIVVTYLIIEPALQSFTNGHLLPLVGDPTPINLSFAAIFIVGIVLAATIPGVILFAPDFGKTLQHAFNSKVGGVRLRQALVVAQFSISTVLMISVFVISNQLKYMNSKDKGINMKNVLIVQAPITKDSSWQAKRKTLELFKEKCAALPFVTEIASSTTIPSEEYRQETFLSLPNDNNKSMVHQNGVDEYFFEFYDVKFLAGHGFIPDARWKNRTSIILNESAAKALGIVDFDKSINTKIRDHESDEVFDLIGIVAYYHQTSLKYEMRPIAFKYNVFRGHFSFKINRSVLNDVELSREISTIEKVWDQTYPDAPFDYFFLDERYAAQDREDQYFGKLFNYFTALSIVISCLGLFGLSLLISTKRQREIGVRKVFGASSARILGTFLKSYVRSLCLSVIIGAPLAYLLMNRWLSNYAYRIEIGFGVLASAVISLTLIFLATIAYHTIRSSVANPVKILRD